MITKLNAKNFKAVPYLETSELMQSHPQGLVFADDKPNVIVGPNGAGKSACLKALAILTLSYFGGISALDDNYTGRDSEGETFWEETRYRSEYAFLPGLTQDYDLAPARYYRPGHIPGNDDSITAAMMCGYFKEARAYGELVDEKSSGQQSQAVMEELRQALSGDVSGIAYRLMNWDSGTKPRVLERNWHYGDFYFHIEELKKRLAAVPPQSKPMLLMDEPEQSLDAKAEALLWRLIAQADTSKMQIIAATHSLYPLMHPEQFNIIEAVPGYAQEVRALL